MKLHQIRIKPTIYISKIIYFFSMIALILMVVGCSRHMMHEATTDQLIQNAENAYLKGRLNYSAKLLDLGLSDRHANIDPFHRAKMIELLSRVELEKGNYEKSIKHAKKCVQLTLKINNTLLNKQCLIHLASNYRHKGHYKIAEKNLTDAANGSILLIEDNLKAVYFLSLGALYQAQGNLTQAKSIYEKSLNESRRIGDTFFEARALNNLGGVLRQNAEYTESLRHYQQSLALGKRINDRVGLASTFGNLCNFYYNLGNLKEARRNCLRAIRIARRLGAKAQEANSLNTLGVIYREDGEMRKAFNTYKTSAQLKLSIGDIAGYARSLNNLGEHQRAKGKYDEAFQYFSKALALKQTINNNSELAYTWRNIGLTHELLESNSQAMNSYHRSLVLQTASDNPEGLWRTFVYLSRLHYKLKNSYLAIFYGKQAISVLQNIRKNLNGFNDQEKQLYFINKRNVYESLADMLIDHGRIFEAQQVMTMYKQVEFNDYFHRSSNVDSHLNNPPFIQIEREQIEKYTKLSQILSKLNKEYDDLKSVRKTGGFSPENKARLNELEIRLGEAQKQYQSFFQNLLIVFKQDNLEGDQARFHELEFDRIRSFMGTIQELAKDLNTKLALIYFFFIKEQLNIFVSFEGSFMTPLHIEPKVSRGDLYELINEFSFKLKNKQPNPIPIAKALYDKILGPIREFLDERQVKSLLISLDQSLRYVPIAALHDGKDYIATNFETITFTPESIVKLSRPPRPDKRIAGFGVSKEVHEDFEALAFVEAELNEIVKEDDKANDKGVIPGQIYLNEDFSKEEFKSVLSIEKPYSVIHIASHYRYVPNSPTESYLLTGKGEELTLKEIEEEDYPMWEVDLVTLSACETAVDNVRDANGIEIDGLANTMISRGAKSVIATLWKVDDESTARFMQDFYQTRQSQSFSKAKSLQHAQQKFIQGRYTKLTNLLGGRNALPVGDDIQQASLLQNYSHPYYWAPFILIGNFL